MFRQSFLRQARLFSTTSAVRSIREPSAHTIAVSKAQGIANGLTEGTNPPSGLRYSHVI